MSDITLSASIRANLQTLRGTEQQLERTGEVAGGDGVGQGISALQSSLHAMLSAIEGAERILTQMRGVVLSAKSAQGDAVVALRGQFVELGGQLPGEQEAGADTFHVGLSATTTLGPARAAWPATADAAGFDAALERIDAAILAIRSDAKALGAQVVLLQARRGLSAPQSPEMKANAGKLAMADLNGEGANLVALQIRQQMGLESMPLANQQENSILQLFLS